jgi:hypothetical protein
MRSVATLIALLLLFFLSFSIALACSPPGNNIHFTCRDGRVFSDRIAVLFDKLQARCGLTDIERFLLSEAVVAWNAGSRGAPLDRDLTILPYTIEAERDALRANANLFQCHYFEIRQIGDWLLLAETGREYCPFVSVFSADLCPHIRFSHTGFMFYLLTHINWVTLPYLIGFVLVCAGILRLIQNIASHEYVQYLLHPQFKTIALAALITFFYMLFFATTVADVLVGLIVIYIGIASFIYQFYS